MRRQRLSRIILLALLPMSVFSMAISCASPEGETSGKIGVVVTILPQVEFVESVGGDRVEVTVMVPWGVSPHTYAPTPGQLVAVKQASMYAKVGSGVEFELIHMDNMIAANKDMLVVDCSKGIELLQNDPHIWLSPENAMVMVENICRGLIAIDPLYEEYYIQNRDEYLMRLNELDQSMKKSFVGKTNGKFMVFHPAWGYFARDYDLTQISVEEEGKQPTAAGIAALVEQARRDKIKVVFVSPQFDAQSAKAIAEAIGGEVVLIDPLAQDYVDNMGVVLEKLILAME